MFFFLQTADEENPHGTETITYIEKHVEFTDDLMNDEEENRETHFQQQQKLHRRDTPHHLKNKRILNKQNDPISIDITTKMISHSPTASSITSNEHEVKSTRFSFVFQRKTNTNICFLQVKKSNDTSDANSSRRAERDDSSTNKRKSRHQHCWWNRFDAVQRQ